MQIVAHSLDGRYIVARSDSPKADGVVVGRTVSPVVPVGSITVQAEADEWLPGAGEATPEEIRKVLERASGPLG